MADKVFIHLRGRNEDGTRSNDFTNITAICSGITIEGQVKAACRKLTFSTLREGQDYYLHRGDVTRGDLIIVNNSGSVDPKDCIFYGVVWNVDIDDSDVVKSITAWNSIKFLLISDALTATFTDETAADITTKVCKELGVTPGKMPDCDTKVSVNGRGKSGYEVIMIAWTETRKQTGGFYYPLMTGYKLNIIEKGEQLKDRKLLYRPENLPCSLISVRLQESSETAITALWERNENGDVTLKDKDQELINRLGYIVGVNDPSKQSANQDDVKVINEGEKHASVSAIGDWVVQTGWSISIKSKTLTEDTLYIEADRHTYDNGIHTMDLTLSYENSMDEIENPKDESGGEGGMTFGAGTVKEQIWSFLRLQGFSSAATAGIMGNMMAESGCIPDINENDGTSWNGYGLCQWTNTGAGDAARRTNLENWCASNGYDVRSAQGQLNYLMHEYNNHYKSLFPTDYMQETSPEQAASDWLAIFEGCPHHSTEWQRQQYARGFYNQWQQYVVIPSCAVAGDGSVSDGAVSASQASVIKAATYTGSTGVNLCADWVTHVFDQVGIHFDGDACTMVAKYCHSNNPADLKPGMIVGCRSWPDGGAGATFGHVAIYVGNNTIKSSELGYVADYTLERFIRQYGGGTGVYWGWGGNVPLN